MECDRVRLDSQGCVGAQLGPGISKKIAVSTFGKLTSNDLACWLVSLPGGPQKIILDLMDAKDPDSIQDTCTFLLQLRKHDVLPKSLNGDIRVLHRFLGRRLMQVGNRLVGFFSKVVSAQGDVDFAKMPVYLCNWGAERLDSVKHISGAEAIVPRHVVITDKFKMINPHSDADASFSLPPSSQPVKDLFASDEGPNKFTVDKKGAALKLLADKAKEEVDAEDNATRSGVVETSASDGTILESRPRQLKAAALERARAALASKPKRARTMEFDK